VAIARCLAMEPELILFDEPTSALDPTMISEVLSVIRRLAKDGMTLAIVTHEMEFARNIASRIFYMDEGSIYEEGPPEQIFDNPQREKTRAFINRVRSFNYHIANRDYDLYAMNGLIETFCIKHLLGQKMTDRIELLVEEMLGLLPEITDLDLRVAYSEKAGSIELAISSAGAPADPLTAGSQSDDLGIRLIRSRCESIQYSYDNGRNYWLVAVHPT
jgi:polar amino acid transport system ATP-binding protein